MEKPKRGTQKSSSQLIIFLLAIIALLTTALGAVVFTIQVDSTVGNPVLSDGIIPNDSVTSRPIACAPLKRTYLDPIVNNERQTTASYNTTATPASSGSAGGNAGIVITSVASMSNNNPAQNIQATMSGPATYTPMPTQMMMPLGTPMPPTQASQTNTTTYNPPAQSVTELNARLNAGEIDDNTEWDVYMSYLRNFAESPANASPVDSVDVRDRQLIRIVNLDGEPILGASVDILTSDNKLIQSSCTYATGYTMFLPHLYDLSQREQFHIRVSKAGIKSEADVELSDEEWTVRLDVEQEQANLDLLFLIDATGSMDDEIAQLTNNILYISEEINKLPDEINVRYGLVSYKDGNYPTQVWDFTPDVNQFQSELAQLFTAGGDGETLNDGLDRALHAVQWRGDDTAKLIFLVGDEPPGVYEEHPSYAVSMLLAGQAGIKVHPIASSGLDLQGEYIFRQIAQTTMGQFIFLTYDNGQTAVQTTGDVEGSVGDEAFGEYSVEQLHEIVLNLIQDEILTFRGNVEP